MKKLILILSLLLSAHVSSATTYVYNVTKDEVVHEYASERVRPIASVTKLMTAIVVIESGAPLNEKVSYRGFLGRKELSREELLKLLLVKSDNQAAEALAKAHSGGRSSFIANMNHRAEQLGMIHTQYEDPSGIGRNNISNARDLSILLNYAYNFDTMKNLAAIEQMHVTQYTRRKVKRNLVVQNTNYNLLKEYKEIEISKTGFTNAAGKCLAMLLTKNGEKYTIVILGERNTRDVQRVGKKIIEAL
jgi:serine-type D-Ala-D-Ala endopeptidase (penicillin-binding protein 7)